jgi:CDP-diacylglycerol--glycerol-3-phosphate 3-phosphatidyltransferase
MENSANKVTIFRTFLIPVIIVISAVTRLQDNYYNYICVALIVIFGLGDVLDGYLARKYEQITDFGAFLDPFADKYMVVSCCMVLVYHGKLPLWYLLLVFNKDVFVFGAWIIYFLKTNEMYLSPNIFGKSSTVFQTAVIVLAFLGVDQKIVLYSAIFSVTVTLLAGVVYLSQGAKTYVGAKSKSGNLP